jgi:hypothetical protein
MSEPADPPTPRRKPKREVTTIGGRTLKPSTLMMGYGYDPVLSEGSLKPPIFLTSTFVFESWSGDISVPLGAEPIDGGTSVEAEALRTGLPTTTWSEQGEHELLGQPSREPGPLTAIAMPVPGWNGPYGVLTVLRPADEPFTLDEIGYLRATASVLSLAVQRQGAQEEIDSFLRGEPPDPTEQRPPLRRGQETELLDETLPIVRLGREVFRSIPDR